MSDQQPGARRKVVLWLLGTLVVAPFLYVLSIGPVSPLLLYHGGESGYQIWQSVYGEPLGKLPPTGRSVVNWYLSLCDRAYWRIRRWE